MSSQLLFGPFFAGPSWARWKAVIKATFGEPMTQEERNLFEAVADRPPPSSRVRELVTVAGRGAGKDSIASLLAVMAAINFNPKGQLRPGERAVVMCLACDRSQARIVVGYIQAYFHAVPALAKLVIGETRHSISLSNGVDIEVYANDFRAIRGRSLLMCIFDELAFWSDETSANPDAEVALAVAPGLARVKNSMLVMISSAHRRAGLLYSRWAKYFGKENDDDILVVKGTTLDFNPSFDGKTIRRSLEQDREKFGAEYLSEWRDDLSAFITRDLLDKLVDRNVVVRAPVHGTNYISGVDASGGRVDSVTAAFVHREKDGAVILDALYERKSPFNPSEVVAEIVAMMRQYSVRQVTGDNFGAQWVAESFQKAGTIYVKSSVDRSGIYRDLLPLLTSGRARLLDNAKLLNQLAALERRTFPTGKERIDPGPGHDDLANSCAIAMSVAAMATAPFVATMPFVDERPRTEMGGGSGLPDCISPYPSEPGIAHGPEYASASPGVAWGGPGWLAGILARGGR